MRDAVTSRHQVQLSALERDVLVERITMPLLSEERPGDRLQSDVRMRFHAHAHLIRAEAIEEAPCSDRRQVAVGQSTQHTHRAYSAEWNLTRFERDGALTDRHALAASAGSSDSWGQRTFEPSTSLRFKKRA